ncbi:MAG: ATP-binding protein [Proteobacteria bacterium]|nr:ATP-binding protein [Pseudomonadota bacterium]
MKMNISDFQRNRSLLYGGVTAAILMVVATALLALAHLRQESEMQAASFTQNLTQSVDQTIHGLIDTIDVALLASDDEISRQMSAGKVDGDSITRFLVRQKERLQHVAFMRAMNESGDVIYGPDIPSTLTNSSDREFFIRLRDDPKMGLFIAKPFIGKIAQKWLWTFARRINKPDGSFGGVVFAAMYIDELEQLLAQIKLEPGSAVSVRDEELGLIARSTFDGANPVTPGDKRLSTAFREALQTNPREGTFISDKTTPDSVSRIYSYRRDTDYGFTINVGIAREPMLAEWRHQAWAAAALASGFILLALVFALLIGRAWRRQEEYFRFFQLSTDAMCIADPFGCFKQVNPALMRLTGFSESELTAKPFLELVLPEDRERTAEEMKLQVAARPSLHFENRYVCKDGKVLTLSWTGYFDKNRGITYAAARDFTERKQAEEELKRSNAELEQFSYAISHDMRQPLRMISSYLQLLEMEFADQLEGERREYFNFAIDGAKRLDQMLVALLEYSRVGRIGEPPERVDSRAILDEALLILQPAVAEAQAKLSVTGNWPTVCVSRDEILRLLQNLIENALKFRVAGRMPEISVISEMADGFWRISVSDNGVGIIPDQIERLFQVFQRLQSRTAYAGTGVGLALCRKIAEHHHGRIWAESAGVDQGSSFRVELPCNAHPWKKAEPCAS